MGLLQGYRNFHEQLLPDITNLTLNNVGNESIPPAQLHFILQGPFELENSSLASKTGIINGFVLIIDYLFIGIIRQHWVKYLNLLCRFFSWSST